jgi:hypothetical protein
MVKKTAAATKSIRRRTAPQSLEFVQRQSRGIERISMISIGKEVVTSVCDTKGELFKGLRRP